MKGRFNALRPSKTPNHAADASTPVGEKKNRPPVYQTAFRMPLAPYRGPPGSDGGACLPVLDDPVGAFCLALEWFGQRPNYQTVIS
jgi:hypothetical protein